MGASSLGIGGSGGVGNVVFFSSRRRHTSCSRDWSSDVCSSDLSDRHHDREVASHAVVMAIGVYYYAHRPEQLTELPPERSAERRVGYACSSPLGADPS